MATGGIGDANGCYVLMHDGSKFAIKRSLAIVLQKLFIEQKVLNGSVGLHFKSGGLSAVETKVVYQPDDF